MGYVGWALPEAERAALLAAIPARYPDVIAHHVTLKFGVTEDYPLPVATNGRIVGIADDDKGLQAVVVAIDGTTDRPDGSTYHITWSLDRAAGYKAVQSNTLIREGGWSKISVPIDIELVPTFFSS